MKGPYFARSLPCFYRHIKGLPLFPAVRVRAYTQKHCNEDHCNVRGNGFGHICISTHTALFLVALSCRTIRVADIILRLDPFEDPLECVEEWAKDERL